MEMEATPRRKDGQIALDGITKGKGDATHAVHGFFSPFQTHRYTQGCVLVHVRTHTCVNTHTCTHAWMLRSKIFGWSSDFCGKHGVLINCKLAPQKFPVILNGPLEKKGVLTIYSSV